MQPETIINTLLRHNNSSTMIKAAQRLIMPLVRMSNPELTGLVVTLLGRRVLSTVKDIDGFQQEMAIAIGYLPVEFSTEATRRNGLGAIFDYSRYCTEHGRVLIVVQFHEGSFGQGSATVLLNSCTRSPFGGFSEAEQQAIDNLTLGYCVKHQGLLLPDRTRRYRTPFVNDIHGVATRMHAALTGNGWSVSR